MPALTKTPEIGAFILAERAKGVSNVKIAEAIEKTFGTKIHPTTVFRHGRPPKGKTTAPASSPIAPVPKADLKPLGPDEALDEVARLEVAIRRIESLLDVTTDARIVAALNAELRQTFRQLRVTKDAAEKRALKGSKDLAAFRDQLLRQFAPVATPSPTPAAPDADRPAVPDVRRASGGS